MPHPPESLPIRHSLHWCCPPRPQHCAPLRCALSPLLCLLNLLVLKPPSASSLTRSPPSPVFAPRPAGPSAQLPRQLARRPFWRTSKRSPGAATPRLHFSRSSNILVKNPLPCPRSSPSICLLLLLPCAAGREPIESPVVDSGSKTAAVPSANLPHFTTHRLHAPFILSLPPKAVASISTRSDPADDYPSRQMRSLLEMRHRLQPF
jgi:hypothetical protein